MELQGSKRGSEVKGEIDEGMAPWIYYGRGCLDPPSVMMALAEGKCSSLNSHKVKSKLPCGSATCMFCGTPDLNSYLPSTSGDQAYVCSDSLLIHFYS